MVCGDGFDEPATPEYYGDAVNRWPTLSGGGEGVLTVRRGIVVAIVLLAAALLAGATGFNPFEVDADRLWTELQRDLTTSTLVSVELRADGRENALMTEAEADGLSQAFLAGTFSEDNPKNFGPTPAVAALFDYAGHELLVVNQWPDGRFELRSAGRQFLIDSPELSALLRRKGFVYQ